MSRLIKYMLSVILLGIVISQGFDRWCGSFEERGATVVLSERGCGEWTPTDPIDELHALIYDALQSDVMPGVSGVKEGRTFTASYRLSMPFRLGVGALSALSICANAPSQRQVRTQREHMDQWYAARHAEGYYIFSLRKIII